MSFVISLRQLSLRFLVGLMDKMQRSLFLAPGKIFKMCVSVFLLCKMEDVLHQGSFSELGEGVPRSSR